MRLLPVFLLFVAGLASAQQQPPVAKVTALSSGKLLLNGSETTLHALSVEFERLKANGGVIWYYRESPQTEPPPQAMEVIKLVVQNQLPVSMSGKPDFSDYIDENGRSRPRKR